MSDRRIDGVPAGWDPQRFLDTVVLRRAAGCREVNPEQHRALMALAAEIRAQLAARQAEREAR